MDCAHLQDSPVSPNPFATSPNPFDERLPTVHERFFSENREEALPDESLIAGEEAMSASEGSVFITAHTPSDTMDTVEHDSATTEQSLNTNPFLTPPPDFASLYKQVSRVRRDDRIGADGDFLSKVQNGPEDRSEHLGSYQQSEAGRSTDCASADDSAVLRPESDDLVRHLHRLILAPTGLFRQTPDGAPVVIIRNGADDEQGSELQFPLPSTCPDPFKLVRDVSDLIHKARSFHANNATRTRNNRSHSSSASAYEGSEDDDAGRRSDARAAKDRATEDRSQTDSDGGSFSEWGTTLQQGDLAMGQGRRGFELGGRTGRSEQAEKTDQRMREMEARIAEDAKKLSELQRLAKMQARELNGLAVQLLAVSGQREQGRDRRERKDGGRCDEEDGMSERRERTGEREVGASSGAVQHRSKCVGTEGDGGGSTSECGGEEGGRQPQRKLRHKAVQAGRDHEGWGDGEGWGSEREDSDRSATTRRPWAGSDQHARFHHRSSTHREGRWVWVEGETGGGAGRAERRAGCGRSAGRRGDGGCANMAVFEDMAAALLSRLGPLAAPPPAVTLPPTNVTVTIAEQAHARHLLAGAVGGRAPDAAAAGGGAASDAGEVKLTDASVEDMMRHLKARWKLA